MCGRVEQPSEYLPLPRQLYCNWVQVYAHSCSFLDLEAQGGETHAHICYVYAGLHGTLTLEQCILTIRLLGCSSAVGS